MNKPRLITLAGAARSGKDTIGQLIAAELGYKIDRFAAPIYTFVEAITGESYQDLQDDERKKALITWIGKSPRQLLQLAGTEWGRDMVHEDLWARCLGHRNRNILRGLDEIVPGIVAPDGRFPNEARFTRSNHGVMVYVMRPGQELIADANHRSENGLTADDCDLTILNSGSLEKLKTRVPLIVEAIQAVHEENERQRERDAEQTIFQG